MYTNVLLMPLTLSPLVFGNSQELLAVPPELPFSGKREGGVGLIVLGQYLLLETSCQIQG